ncbi:MAG: helix-turn-helix domain-containing protein [Roseobacter sp.]|uniref:helix-turn-helix domain-containing protein n=1 Tax=Sphingomonadales TaxID=204457 RepID=UPI003262DE70
MTKLLTLRQCSEEYGISISSIYREIAGGRIKLRKIGRASRISRNDMDAWLDTLPTSEGELAGAQ